MTEYEATLDEINKTMDTALDQFKVIPKDVASHEWAEVKKYAFSETKIPGKYRELIGLAVASAIKCPYCIHSHKRAAKLNGAADEIAEVAFLTRFTSRWSAMRDAVNIDLDSFKKQFAQVEAYLRKQMKT